MGNILDSNNYGLKAELENNEAYKKARLDLAQKRTMIKANKEKIETINKNINIICSIIYGLNSCMLIREIIDPVLIKSKDKVPTQIRITLEGIETVGTENLALMLNDLESEWKVKVDLSKIDNININEMLEEVIKKYE